MATGAGTKPVDSCRPKRPPAAARSLANTPGPGGAAGEAIAVGARAAGVGAGGGAKGGATDPGSGTALSSAKESLFIRLRKQVMLSQTPPVPAASAGAVEELGWPDRADPPVLSAEPRGSAAEEASGVATGPED